MSKVSRSFAFAKQKEGKELRKIKFDKNLCNTCHSCEIACGLKHSAVDDINLICTLPYNPVPRLQIIEKKSKPHVVRCVFCKNPKCVPACPEGAITQDEDGFVSIDAGKCDGCWQCIEACPFDAIRKFEAFNISVKCDLCLGAETPACVEACPVQALIVV